MLRNPKVVMHRLVMSLALLGTSKCRIKSQVLFRHATRITNYQNPLDSALKMSNVRRLGSAPIVGRVGIPSDAPENLVNVNVGEYWSTLKEEESEASGTWSPSWHFDDAVFAKDLFLTLQGDIDRSSIPTREVVGGQLILRG